VSIVPPLLRARDQDPRTRSANCLLAGVPSLPSRQLRRRLRRWFDLKASLCAYSPFVHLAEPLPSIRRCFLNTSRPRKECGGGASLSLCSTFVFNLICFRWFRFCDWLFIFSAVCPFVITDLRRSLRILDSRRGQIHLPTVDAASFVALNTTSL